MATPSKGLQARPALIHTHHTECAVIEFKGCENKGRVEILVVTRWGGEPEDEMLRVLLPPASVGILCNALLRLKGEAEQRIEEVH